ncbi:MAG: DNA repair protein RecO [Micrococcales bacterium]|nr:DNA repair protein RecO [Micrococcales bacterium]
MKTYRDAAIVLRTHKLGEADRIVTLLTRHHGRVRAVAKGVRRTTSRIGARMEPFMHVDVLLHKGRSLDIVTQVETLGAYAAPIADDFALYTAASAMVEAAEKLTEEEGEPATQLFLLLAGGLRALSTRAHPAGLILDSFLVRALAIAGYAPSFDACARCGAPGPHRAFSPQVGGAVCADCRPSGAAAPSVEALNLLGALLAADWPTAEASSEPARRQAAGLAAAYAQWHLDRPLRSLAMVGR